MTIDELRAEMKSEFERTRSEVQGEFTSVRQEFANVRTDMKKLREEMKAEGGTTRRHFDILAESVRDSVKIVAEVNAHHASRLNNHETRLKVLEKNRRG